MGGWVGGGRYRRAKRGGVHVLTCELGAAFRQDGAGWCLTGQTQLPVLSSRLAPRHRHSYADIPSRLTVNLPLPLSGELPRPGLICF